MKRILVWTAVIFIVLSISTSPVMPFGDDRDLGQRPVTRGFITFSGIPPTIPVKTVYCTPNGGACSPVRTTAEVAIQAMEATSLKCWATSAPGFGGFVTMRLGGVYGALSCTIGSSDTECSATGRAVFRDGDEMCLAIDRIGTPIMSPTITCSIQTITPVPTRTRTAATRRRGR